MKSKQQEIERLLQQASQARQADPAQCRVLSLRAKALCETSGCEHGLISALCNLAELHKDAYEFEPAYALLEQAFTLLKKPAHANHPATFDLFVVASAVHTRLGNTPEALAYGYQAEEIALAEKDVARQALVYRMIGNTQILSNEPDNAIVTYKKALSLFEKLVDKTGIATILNNMCHTYHRSERYDEALEVGLAGLALHESSGQEANIPRKVYAYNLNNVGNTYLGQKAYETAVQYFEKASAIFKEESDVYGEIYSLRGMANVKFHNQAFEEAFGLFELALEKAKTSEILVEVVQSHLALANALKETGKFQKALFHYEKFHEAEKRILNDEAEKKIRKLESTYKIQKAKQEAAFYQLRNEVLQKEIQKRKKAEEAAEAAARAKAEFLANMSHEIRTPLNGIIGVTELMENTPLTPQQEELVQIIQSSSDALLRIINDILDFSKIEAGKLELEEMLYPLHQAVETAVDLLVPKALEKGLEIGCIIEPSVPKFVMGDMVRFQQILVNLLGNGVKFTESGAVFVYLDSRLISRSRVELHVTVQDTGIGIDEAGIARLFRSFSQVDNSITRKYGGTGLGLAISSQLAALMGGRMWVESTPGNGSEFHFTIQTDFATLEEEELELYEDYLEGKLALVAVSHEKTRHSLRNQLAIIGLQTIEAQDINQATALLEQRAVDIIFAGDTLLEKLFAEKICGRLPLVAIVSRAVNITNLPPVTEVIQKPVKQSVLAHVLKHSLDTAIANAPRELAQPAQLPGLLHPLSILVAEDNEINQRVAKKLLIRLGYDVELVGNGLEVLDKLADGRFDVILMDIQMPEMDGISAMKEVHKRYGAKERPYIIAMTAHALTGDREKLLESGMDDYISKPVRLEQLAEVLLRVPN